MLRGVLDLCLLAVVVDEPAYGYEMTRRLRDPGLSTVGEGSIYPLLGRLERDGLFDDRCGGGGMTAFVEECRREWERLGVPDLLADEMAAELAADLAEAEAEGVSATEIVGESDPRRFAAT